MHDFYWVYDNVFQGFHFWESTIFPPTPSSGRHIKRSSNGVNPTFFINVGGRGTGALNNNNFWLKCVWRSNMIKNFGKSQKSHYKRSGRMSLGYFSKFRMPAVFYPGESPCQVGLRRMQDKKYSLHIIIYIVKNTTAYSNIPYKYISVE